MAGFVACIMTQGERNLSDTQSADLQLKATYTVVGASGAADMKRKLEEAYKPTGDTKYKHLVVQLCAMLQMVDTKSSTPQEIANILMQLRSANSTNEGEVGSANVPTNNSIRESIKQGRTFVVQFDKLQNHIANIFFPGTTLTGRYLNSQCSWRVSGPVGPDHKYASNEYCPLGAQCERPRIKGPCNPADGNLILFGGQFKFDDNGQVSNDGGVVGSLLIIDAPQPAH